MSPDIEWHIGEDAERETVVQTTHFKPSRWRKVLTAIIVGLGIGLGVWYQSIPVPLPPPTPTPIPTDTPLPPAPPLEEFIAREARALSSGDMQAYLSLLDSTDFSWRQAQISSYTLWGAPPNAELFYTVIATGGLDDDQAWADVIQYRKGQYFRELRFYRRTVDGWLRRSPVRDEAAWGEPQTTITPYFEITFHKLEAPYAAFLRDEIALRYEQECRKFGCDPYSAAPFLHLALQPANNPQRFNRDFRSSQGFTLTLLSPAVAGVYYKTLDGGLPGDNAQIDRVFDHYLFYPLLAMAAGGFQRGGQHQGSGLYVFAIGAWELARKGSSELPLRFEFWVRPDVVTDTTQFIPLANMWQLPPNASTQQRSQLLAQASMLIDFMDKTYGAEAVYRFFRALRRAQSLPQAIEMTGLPYSEFEKKWQAWLKNLNHESL